MISKVNLYIETYPKGPGIKKIAGYMWILEYQSEKINQPITLKGCGTLSLANEPRAALTALVEALDRMTKESEIRIYSDCQHILNTCQNGWLPRWKENGWKLSNGKDVKNIELWQRAYELMDKHLIEWALHDEPNTYKSYMQFEITREVNDALDRERNNRPVQSS